jgi:NAD(P)-dependent dehydrogenase (short-subunit alcohol dehydrogenase family)
MKISEARAVVTGGASGLGNAVARYVAAEGGQVTLLDVQEGPGRAAAAELGAGAAFVKCDVTSKAEVSASCKRQANAWAASIFSSTARALLVRRACSDAAARWRASSSPK